MPTISSSIRGLTATLAMVVTLPSASIWTGVLRLTAAATSTATGRGPDACDFAACSPSTHLSGGYFSPSSSGSPNMPQRAAPTASASTNTKPTTALPLVISRPARDFFYRLGPVAALPGNGPTAEKRGSSPHYPSPLIIHNSRSTNFLRFQASRQFSPRHRLCQIDAG